MEAAIGASHVLLVDDEEHVRKAYGRALKRAGLDVTLASDGAEALAAIQSVQPDVVLTDISMPSMNGVEFLRAVRERDIDVPVVIMTGDPSVDTAIAALEHGAFRYLLKPIDLATLVDTIRRAANLRRVAVLKREAWELMAEGTDQAREHATLAPRLDRALDQLWMAYQPIVMWPHKRVFGYEALMRSREVTLATPEVILDAAGKLGRLNELGRVVRRRVAESAIDAPVGALLFVNVNAEDLNDAEMFSSDAPLSQLAARRTIVLEITERSALTSVVDLAGKLKALRACGFQIAVDDLGAGYSGLSSFSRLDPEYVKLDMSLIGQVHTSAKMRNIVRQINRLCAEDLGMKVICEGVEYAEQRDALADENIHLLQGFLFGRPAPRFASVSWETR